MHVMTYSQQSTTEINTLSLHDALPILDKRSHEGKTLRRILETFPRDELFQCGSAELYEIVTAVAAINDRYQVRLFIRPDSFGKFVNCLVYVPRDLFSTNIRRRIQTLLEEALHAEEADFNTYLSESILARVHMVFRVDPASTLDYDAQQLEQEIVELTRSWDNRLRAALTQEHGEER